LIVSVAPCLRDACTLPVSM